MHISILPLIICRLQVTNKCDNGKKIQQEIMKYCDTNWFGKKQNNQTSRMLIDANQTIADLAKRWFQICSIELRGGIATPLPMGGMLLHHIQISPQHFVRLPQIRRIEMHLYNRHIMGACPRTRREDTDQIIDR